MPVFALVLAIGLYACQEDQDQSTGILSARNDSPASILAPKIEPPVAQEVSPTLPKPKGTPQAFTPPPTPTPKPTPEALKGVSGEAIVNYAKKYIGTVEKPGNRGAIIDQWNRDAGVPIGSPYCGSFAGGMHKLAGFAPPKGYAYTPSWFGRNLIKLEDSKPGDVQGFYFPDKGRIAHIGIIEKYGIPYVSLIEANTSYDARAGTASDREGDGVHRKLRNTKILSQGKNKTARYW